MNEVVGRGPTANGGGGHGLLLSQGIGELLDEVVEAVIAGSRGWDPVRGTGKKGEPIGGGSADDDAVDGVLQLPKERIGR